MSEHSELPWRRGIGYRDDLILDAEDRIIARSANNSENTKNWEIDAPLIVLAANHHHALVKALESISSYDDCHAGNIARAALAAIKEEA